jgi:hypothetical protein
MTNLNKLEKSKGVVLFATNTATIDYEAIANRASLLISHYLKLPVTIITESIESKNQRYSIDSGKFEQWRNAGRARAYALSPYDQTILLDSDYLIFDDNLLKILDTVDDYTIARHNTYIDGATANKMGTYSLPTLWATVVVFNKTPRTKLLFDLIGKIERNYGYYRRLYNINESNFRNDYAFTIADNILNGYCQDPMNYLPWPIVSFCNKVQSIKLKDGKLLIKSDTQAWAMPQQSLHVMSKAYLLSDDCTTLIEGVVNARI